MSNTSTNDKLLADLSALLRGIPGSSRPLANAFEVHAWGFDTFGRTDALDLFTHRPVMLSANPYALFAPCALAVLDVTPDGRLVGVFADVVDNTLARVWVVGAVADDAATEPGVPVASDDFLTQDRTVCAGDLLDHPCLDNSAWPQVQASAVETLLAAQAGTSGQTLAAASSSQVVVVRAFGSNESFVALYTLRLLSNSVPRVAQRRWALAACRIDTQGSLLHRRLAISDALPAPTFVQI